MTDLKCPRCGGIKFNEIDCGSDSYENDVTYVSYECVACGLWYSGWSGKWFVDNRFTSDEDEAEEFISPEEPQ